MTTSAEPPVTGHPAIDEALGRLDLSGPVAEHADEIQRVHQVLQDVLNPSPSGPSQSAPTQSAPPRPAPAQAASSYSAPSNAGAPRPGQPRPGPRPGR